MVGVRRRLFAHLSVLVLAMSLVPLGASPAVAAADGLFMSEYIEGSSFNKAIEIYNGTGGSVDLSTYTLELYSNGSATVSQSVGLSGSLADGDVFVAAHGSADPEILAVADVTNSSVINFNGDDAVVLRNNGAVVDAFGQIGFDPGSQWAGGGQDDTLRRADGVCSGDSVADDSFDASLEWVVFPNNTFDGLGAHAADCNGTTGPALVINEFSASTTGTDVEYVEIYGDPNTDYSNYSVLELEGDFSGSATGTVDEVIGLGTTDADGFYLASLAANALENGSISLLLVENFTGAAGNDLDTDDDGVLDTTPWDQIIDGVAVYDGGASDLTYAVPALGPNYDGVSSFAPGGASRIPDGTDTDTAADWVRNDFDLAGIPGITGTPIEGEALNTPGATNVVFVPPPLSCDDPLTVTLISTVQGSGLSSPLEGQDIVVDAVVTGVFAGLGGFYIQEEPADSDGDPLTSEGVFVFGDVPAGAVVGDVVRVQGTVSEFSTSGGASLLTEITPQATAVCSDPQVSVPPADVTFPVSAVSALEAYEGMLVRLPQAMVISEYFNFDRFGETVVTSTRHVTPTAEFEPGSPEQAQAAQDYLLDRITIDDGRSAQNPDPAIHPGNGAVFDLDNLFRGGDTITGITGVIDDTFGLYRLQPTEYGTYQSTNPRPGAPDDVGGSLEVSAFNVLNYFTTLDYPTGDPLDNMCGPSQNQECRGADANQPDEFTRQRDKIIAALGTMSSDVVGLIEIENHPGDVPTADLVSGLNDSLGAGTYDFIATGAIGTDAIRVALIYKPDTVMPIGEYSILDSSVDPRFNDDRNRPVLAQTFMDKSTGGIFTVAVNHLKSKGSACDDIGDPDLGDGAGNCNLTREAAAKALVDWLGTDPTGSEDDDFLIIGDLNSYDKEDPIDAILAGGYTDLIRQFLGEDAYSYVFDGQTGYLDYSLASADLLGEITGVTVWHINADEPDLIDYDTSFKLPAQDAIYAPDAYRASDHDPVITGLDVCDEIAPTFDELSVTPDELWPANHKYVDVEATVVVSDNFDENPTITLVSVESDEPDDAPGNGDGNTVNDIVIVDDFHFQLRAERAGGGDGRTYAITYEVTDGCGNSTTASVTVFVPHDQGN